jgi:hypothetical protein
MWIPGTLTTVLNEHNRPKAPAAVTISFDIWRWFTETSRGGIVVLGNQPIPIRVILFAKKKF